MNRQELMDYMVRHYGHENRWVIWFFECAECLNDESLRMAYIAAEFMIEKEWRDAEKEFWDED